VPHHPPRVPQHDEPPSSPAARTSPVDRRGRSTSSTYCRRSPRFPHRTEPTTTAAGDVTDLRSHIRWQTDERPPGLARASQIQNSASNVTFIPGASHRPATTSAVATRGCPPVARVAPPEPTITTFWVVSLLFMITPGADWAYAISAGLRYRTVFPAVGGLLAGHLLATEAAGVAALVARPPLVLTGLTVAGAGCLVWLGVGMLRPARQRLRHEAARPRRAHPRRRQHPRFLRRPRAAPHPRLSVDARGPHVARPWPASDGDSAGAQISESLSHGRLRRRRASSGAAFRRARRALTVNAAGVSPI
jgi:hypothetical protein